MTTQASVVVPTYKRPALLDRCLGALVAQDVGPGAYEIVVVDDAADPDTERQVLRWAGRMVRRGGPLIRYVAVRGAHGPAVARNKGWRAAHGDVVAFTDDDCVPSPRWLGEGVRALASGAEAAWGRLVMPLPPRPTDYERDAAGLSRAEFVTANCFCRRDVLAAAGGFDERFTAAWREDSDLQFTLLEQGRRVAYAPNAVVVHPARPAPWGVSLSQQSKSRFEALLYKKHPALYRRKVRPGRPLIYYGIVGALVAAAAFSAAGRRKPARAAAGIWLGLTAVFCARRLRGNSLAPEHLAEMAVTSVLIPPLSLFWRILGAVEHRAVFF